ncbi:MAG: hypothetical protein ACE5HU_06560 [Acidobacteriota bacterium]
MHKIVATVRGMREMSGELLPWATLLGLGYLVVNGELAQEVQKALILWGPGIVLIFMAWQYLPKFIDSQNRQASALSDLAGSVRDQGTGYERALGEIQHGQQVILDRLEHLKEQRGG